MTREQAAVKAKPSRRPQHQKWEDQLFFARLRNHGRILWYMLAFALIAAFVFLGVGSGSTGISEIVNSFFNGTSASSTSLSSLQKKTVSSPKDAAAWLAYANALQQHNELDDAASALTSYLALRPKDSDALRQLAAIYLRRASDWQTLYADSVQREQSLAPSPVLAPSSTSKLGQAAASLTTPLSSAVSSQLATQTNNEYSQFANYLSERLDVWKKLGKLNPDDATTQLSLAQAASDAGQAAVAVTAYKKFLALAPTDSQAPTARQQLKALEAQLKASAKASASSSGKK